MWQSLAQADVTFDSLRENGYDEIILNVVKQELFENLKGNELLKDPKAAEYLLYACINSRDTRYYSLYTCIQPDVQSKLLHITYISNNILQNMPEVIINTPLAKDENSIINNISGKPQIVKYISEDLLKNPEFMNEIMSNEPKVIETIISKNPSLVKNSKFMAEAISKDVTVIKYMNKEMLNNYEVFREASKNNKDIIEYAIQNSEELGLNAITAVNDTARENLKESAREVIEEDIKNNENSKLKDWDKDQRRYEEMNKDSSNAIRDAAMLSQLDKVELQVEQTVNKEQLDSIRLTVIKIKRALEQESDYEIELSDLCAMSQVFRVEMRMIEELEKNPQLKQIIEECKQEYAQIKSKYKEQRHEKSKESRKNFEKLSEVETRAKTEEKSQAQKYVGEVRTLAFDFNEKGSFSNARISAKGEIPLPPELQKEITEHGLPDNTRPENTLVEAKAVQEPVRSVTALRGKEEKSMTK